MRIKFNWFISFCLVLFISVSNFVIAFAEPVLFTPVSTSSRAYTSFSIQSVFDMTGFNMSAYKSVAYGHYTDGSLEKAVIFYSDGDIVLTKGSTQVVYNSPNTKKFGATFNPSYGSSGAPYLSVYDNNLPVNVPVYLVKGVATLGGVSCPVSTEISPPTVPLTDSDKLNFNWNGNGIKIYNLKTGMNISGYVGEDNVKYFDIETYGKFIYNGSDTFFTSYNYKKMQTSIQLASVVTFGSLTRHAGEGLGIKTFEWVSDTSHLNKGDIVKFRIVYKVPMLDKGNYDVKIGTTINDGSADLYISDSVSNVNFLNENWDYGSPLDTSGETGNVGSQPGNQPPSSGSSGYGTNIQENFSSLITLFSSFSGFIGSLFGFLPSEIKILFTVVCSIIVALMVKRAVL